ncbi:MAG: hypothetical protein ABIS67_15875 [Candidatus Eisenbacteria bacterium]
MDRSALLLAPLLALVFAATPAKPPGTPAVAAEKSSAARATAPKQVLPWIEDDLTRAVAEAKARKLPIFVESWAPW